MSWDKKKKRISTLQRRLYATISKQMLLIFILELSIINADTNIDTSLKRQFHKMVKRTKTIRRQFADELFKCVWPFSGVGA